MVADDKRRRNFFLATGIAVVALVGMAVVLNMMGDEKRKGSAKRVQMRDSVSSAARQVSNTPNADRDVDPAYKELVSRDANQRARELASGDKPGAAVLPVLDLAERVEETPPAPQDGGFGVRTTQRGEGANPRERQREMQDKARYLERLLKTEGVLQGAAPAVAVTADVQNEGGLSAAKAQGAADGDRKSDSATQQRTPLPAYRVIPASMITGATSDASVRSVARAVWKGREYRLEGTVRADRYGEMLVLEFNRLIDVATGRLYPVQAIAVAPDTKMPLLRSKISRHTLHNLVWGLGTALLSGYSQYYAYQAQQQQIILDSNGLAVGYTPLDQQALARASLLNNAARQAQSAGRWKAPTVTLEAGERIGVVILGGRTRTGAQEAQMEQPQPDAAGMVDRQTLEPVDKGR